MGLLTAPREPQVLLGLPGLKAAKARRASDGCRREKTTTGGLQLDAGRRPPSPRRRKGRVGEAARRAAPSAPAAHPGRVDPADGVAYLATSSSPRSTRAYDDDEEEVARSRRGALQNRRRRVRARPTSSSLHAPPWHGDDGDTDKIKQEIEYQRRARAGAWGGGIYQIVIGVVGREGLGKLLANGGQMIRRMRQATGADIEFEAYIPQSLDDPPKRLIVSRSAQLAHFGARVRNGGAEIDKTPYLTTAARSPSIRARRRARRRDRAARDARRATLVCVRPWHPRHRRRIARLVTGLRLAPRLRSAALRRYRRRRRRRRRRPRRRWRRCRRRQAAPAVRGRERLLHRHGEFGCGATWSAVSLGAAARRSRTCASRRAR